MPRTMYIEAEETTQDILGRSKREITQLFEQDLDPVFSEMVEIMVGRAKKHEIEGLKDVLVFSPSIFKDDYKIYGDLLKLILKELDIKLPSTHVVKDSTIYNVKFRVNLDVLEKI